jgi:glutaredoxin-like protein
VLSPTPHPASAVTVYWRPGCPFCNSLFRQLERAEIAHERINIWDDPAAAAVVRGIANGNETVPTVVVGGIGMVNPSATQVAAALDTVSGDR